jgi:hypothetical protein
MKKFGAGIFSLVVAAGLAAPLAAQDITCADVSFDERIMTAYPAARDACLEIVEYDGIRYAHFEALVHREGFPTMLLRFKHNDDTWGPATLIRIPASFTVYLEGKPVEAKDVPRGRTLDFFMPEGRWEVAVSDADELVVEEATFAPVEFEVVEMELPEEVDMAAPPLVLDEEGNVDVEATVMADEAAEDAAAYEAEQEADEGAATADDEAADEADDSEWLWILGLAGAFIIVWFLLRRRKARRQAT